MDCDASSLAGSRRALLIGTAASLAELESRLVDRDVTVGPGHRVVIGTEAAGESDSWAEVVIEAIAFDRPDLALVSLPARFTSLISELRLVLRRRGIPDRFVPTLDDLLAGIGPRNLPDIDLEDLLERPGRPLDLERITSLFRGRRVLVTGAGGSIGSELALRIASYRPAEIVLMDRSEQALFEIDRTLARRHPSLSRRASLQDVADRAGTLRTFESCRPNLVLHAAAHKHVPLSEDHPREAVRNNVAGSVSAVEAAAAVGASRFVLISTDKAVAPRSVMGATKRIAEVAVQSRAAEAGLATAVVRFGNVLGSSGSVLDIWRREIADGGPLTLTDRRMTRYLMTIPEAAGLVLQAACLASDQAPVGRVHVLDMGAPVRILDLARRFARANGLELVEEAASTHDVPSDGIGIVETGARPGEKLA
ncbi:MAG: polysaccharide biosynthesis protein, partial [Planctomycetota bacterium]|nr:polysaccharide biosynthesis protein [Planctomycetota bacterium]